MIWFGARRIAHTALSLEVERKHLFESDLRFRSLADTAPVLIWMSDQTKACTYFNKGWCDFTGREFAALLGNGWAEDVHPDDLDECIRIYERSFDARMPFAMEYRLRRHDGEYRWIIDNGVPRWEINSEFVGYIGSCIDITERKLMEGELQKSELKYRDLIEHSNSIILRWTRDGIITFMNEFGLDFFGYTADELLGQHVVGTIVPENESTGRDLRPLMEQILANQEEFKQNTNENMRRNGDRVWIAWTNKTVQDDLGEISEIMSIGTDITDRKAANLELQANETKYRAMIANIADVIAIIDPNGINLYKSPNVERWFGWRPDEIVGRSTFENVHPDDMTHVLAVFVKILDQTDKAVFGECRYRCKDGTYAWIRFTGSNLLSDPVIGGILLNYHDITEHKKAEAEQNKLEEQLFHAQKMESLGILAGGIVHDFNNILTVILGHCYIATENTDMDPPGKVHFQAIETAGRRAADLCRQMLTYAGKSPATKAQLNLCEQVDEVVKMLQSAIHKNVNIELDLDHTVPKIMGDNSQIQQIIMNLIINAAEAIGEKRGTVKVKIVPKEISESISGHVETDIFGIDIPTASYICLEVSDNGCGMDGATKKRIFEPFFTTKFTGRGLGMSAILGIISSHEGKLQLFSKPRAGTTFRIFFPLPLTADLIETVETKVLPASVTCGTVLLADDEEMLRNMGTNLLDVLGLSCITAINGSDAIAIYRERSNEIDVVILDLIMPEMGGIEAYHELRIMNPLVPIIICSGYGVESVASTIENDIHADFVHKPYRPLELKEKLLGMMQAG